MRPLTILPTASQPLCVRPEPSSPLPQGAPAPPGGGAGDPPRHPLRRPPDQPAPPQVAQRRGPRPPFPLPGLKRRGRRGGATGMVVEMGQSFGHTHIAGFIPMSGLGNKLDSYVGGWGLERPPMSIPKHCFEISNQQLHERGSIFIQFTQFF